MPSGTQCGMPGEVAQEEDPREALPAAPRGERSPPGPTPELLRRFHEECAGSGGLTDVEERLVCALGVCLTRDRVRFGDAFEASVSSDEQGLSTFRWTYGFPACKTEPALTASAVRALAQAQGGAVAQVAEAVLAASASPLVRHVLAGYARAAGGVGPSRGKLYVQFANGAGGRAIEMAREMTGFRGPLGAGGQPLDILGLDVGAGGVRRAKFYFRTSELDEDAVRSFGLRRGAAYMEVVHGVDGPEERDGGRPAGFGFPLRGLELAWHELREAPALSAHPSLRSTMDRLARDFPVRLTWLAWSTREPASEKLTVYFALDGRPG